MLLRKVFFLSFAFYLFFTCVYGAKTFANNEVEFTPQEISIEAGKMIILGALENKSNEQIEVKKVTVYVKGKNNDNVLRFLRTDDFNDFNEILEAREEKSFRFTVNDKSIAKSSENLKYYISADVEALGISNINIHNKVTIQDGKQVLGKFSVVYPLVYMSNSNAQNKINSDISNYVYEFLNWLNNDRVASANSLGMKYKIVYEDDKYLSIRLDRWFDKNSVTYGLVYDKTTGNRVPVTNFINATPAQLDADVKAGKVLLMSSMGEQFYIGSKASEDDRYSRDKQITRISEDYLLLGKGMLGLIYQKYELAAGHRGTPYVIIGNRTYDESLRQYLIKNVFM